MLFLNITARTRHSGRVSAAEREETMQARTTLLSAAVLGFALLGGPARAADLPKEGTITATYSSAGTSKATPLGEERWFASYEEYGLTVGSGLLDHTTWHCGPWVMA